MASVTFSLPNKIKSEMEALSWINWSELAREEAVKKLELQKDFEEFKRIVSKSKLTENDALELARKVNEGMHKRYKKLYSELQ